MDLLLDSEQEMIRDTAAGLLAEMQPVARLHDGEEAFSDALRGRMAENGWLGIALDEAVGGVGYSVVEEMLIFREAGRVLGVAGMLPVVLAAHVAAEAGAAPLVRELVAGRHEVALAVATGPVSTEGAQLSGAFRLFAARDARMAVWVGEQGAALFDLNGVEAAPRLSLDRSVATLDIAPAGATVLAATATSAAMLRGRVLAAAFLQGASEAMRDMIVEYAKVRHTFGRPIGAYQAVRHPCAEMALRSEAARCQLFVAALVLRDGRHDAALQVDAAKLLANGAAVKNADSNIQLHGGIGVTDEHDAQLYLKRVHLVARWLGGDKHLLRRLVDHPIHG
ncbi:acyl-CoA dehydrogenase family protein [Sphingomonas flavalba]|uniref:acyl-CoA dehydrogenase family protein n=1 Tax=Sphingomonas flavalba TaxID=2559804 RepID=UPI0039E030BA